MKCLVTGDQGFVGTHLVRLLESKGYEIHGFDAKNGQDLRDYEAIRTCIDKVRPDYIYHLAAQAFLPESTMNPIRSFEINTIGSINLLEAVKNVGIKPKILLAGTSEEYSATEGDVITEETFPNPMSAYAVSKLAMDYMGRFYAKDYDLDIVIGRTFNHTGPGRGEMYAESFFAKQIVKIENGLQEVLAHGNLESVRNYTDVRDIIDAYTLAIELPSGIYNICSDTNVSIGNVLGSLMRMSKVPIKTMELGTLLRPNDFSFKKPSSKKFRDLTNWKPEYKLSDTLTDLLEDWRERLK